MNKFYNKILTHKYIPKPLGILIIIGINWIFQGILYTKKTETTFKLIFELGLLIIFYNISLFIINDLLSGILFSFFMSHTINWLVNNNLFSLFKTFGIIQTSNETFNLYVDKLKKEAKQNPSISWVGIFGSQAHISHSLFSDIDVRIVRCPGFTSAVKSLFFILKQRIWANLHRFPLDIYLLDNMNQLNSMMEKAIVLKS